MYGFELVVRFAITFVMAGFFFLALVTMASSILLPWYEIQGEPETKEE